MSSPPVPRSADPDVPSYGVVVPLKPSSVGKSRLSGLGDRARRELVEALALDTVAAVAACRAVALVLVVTDDVDLATKVGELSVLAVPDGATGLNAALRQGAAEVVRRGPGLRLGALCGDLPCLRPYDLERVLRRAPEDGPAFVGDAAGVGTTLYVAPALELFRPAFGRGSRDAHLAAGATELTGGVAPSIRRDVDTPADLRAALLLGTGPRTATAAAGLGLA